MLKVPLAPFAVLVVLSTSCREPPASSSEPSGGTDEPVVLTGETMTGTCADVGDAVAFDWQSQYSVDHDGAAMGPLAAPGETGSLDLPGSAEESVRDVHGVARTGEEDIGEANQANMRAMSPVSERTGDAREPVTSDECLAAYKAGESVCQAMPPDAAMGCFLAIKAILAVCLASAR